MGLRRAGAPLGIRCIETALRLRFLGPDLVGLVEQPVAFGGVAPVVGLVRLCVRRRPLLLQPLHLCCKRGVRVAGRVGPDLASYVRGRKALRRGRRRDLGNAKALVLDGPVAGSPVAHLLQRRVLPGNLLAKALGVALREQVVEAADIVDQVLRHGGGRAHLVGPREHLAQPGQGSAQAVDQILHHALRRVGAVLDLDRVDHLLDEPGELGRLAAEISTELGVQVTHHRPDVPRVALGPFREGTALGCLVAEGFVGVAQAFRRRVGGDVVDDLVAQGAAVRQLRVLECVG